MTALLKKIFKAFALKMLLTTGINLYSIRDEAFGNKPTRFLQKKNHVFKVF